MVSPHHRRDSLPRPNPAALAHSQKLQSFIREAIEQNGGQISFARFMELALYSPGLGYYMSGLHKLGASGDFTTAPELSPLFARCLSRQCQQILELLGSGDILEFGAGSGCMAADLLAELDNRGNLPEQYFILELSAELRQRQQQTLQQQVPHLASKVSWLDRLPDNIQGLVLANEVCDAMPVHCFQLEDEHSWERHVGYEGDTFVWKKGPFSHARLKERATEIRLLLKQVSHYTSEVNLAMESWVAEIAYRLQQGMLLIIDYGFPRKEYYHPDRTTGTLMCHYRHRAHPDPLILPGLQDITAHVDFTALAEAGHNSGLRVAGYCSQADFLLACGLDELAMAEIAAGGYHALETSNQIKRLTLPSEMGELFKILALTRGIDPPLLGFSLRDRRARL
ncbi:class I SAM-dependent methyltransferase [Nitrosococcus wardiae]|uniref:SAM-dependent methyltransferase n=1 Tax=Nitrosococcus wardiae TaxID=1814290 RepID=A0A4P7BUW3_9GAMM|nr:SAM-dependent methyltransferase [Nitrosococcus wardiae]QBQ53758.1 SAM-dependent methyltransferase [Nitrosococcus wardiae]